MTDIPSGYTPGPWNADGPDWAGDYNITPPHEAAVVAAVISNVRPASEVEANARLIALAPEMADEIVRLRAEVERLQSEAYEYANTCRAIPDEFALVPPDGGDVKPWEVVSDMANTITRYREALSILGDHWKHGYGGPTRADVICAVQDIARAALTAQEAPNANNNS